jgi:membrane associated rhomboid family serine protease
MNNGLIEDLKYKVFRSGNPIFLYIGLNAIVFIVTALLGVLLFLSGNGSGGIAAFIGEYFAFPADVTALPLRFYTLLTYMFFHDNFFHVLFNMLWVYWLGQIFMNFMNSRQFHFIYLAGGICGAILFTAAFYAFPVFQPSIPTAHLIGSSAAVIAIVTATATLVPDYEIRMLFLGNVKLKYLALAYILLSIIGVGSANAGGNIAHIGGAIFGFTYVKMLRSGTDWSNLFKKKPKLKVVKNKAYNPSSSKTGSTIAQSEIDAILDKISKSGYDKLSKEEKETLFKASNH